MEKIRAFDKGGQAGGSLVEGLKLAKNVNWSGVHPFCVHLYGVRYQRICLPLFLRDALHFYGRCYGALSSSFSELLWKLCRYEAAEHILLTDSALLARVAAELHSQAEQPVAHFNQLSGSLTAL